MRTLTLTFALGIVAVAPAIDADKPLVARNPTLSQSSIAFEFGTDIWIVGREGGQARRLTSGPGAEAAKRAKPGDRVQAPSSSLIIFSATPLAEAGFWPVTSLPSAMLKACQGEVLWKMAPWRVSAVSSSKGTSTLA